MLKKIIFGLLGLLVLLLLISFLLPSRMAVERSIIVNAPEDVVFFQVSDLQKMISWNPWLAKDSETLIEFGPKRSGTGAYYSWKSKFAEVGSGNYKILKSNPFERISTEIDFYGKGKEMESFTFAPVNNGIKVSWTKEKELGSDPVSRYRGLMMDRAIGGEMEKGLASLRTNCDKIVGGRNTAIEQMNRGTQAEYIPRQVDFPERKYIAARKVVAMRNMEGHMENYFSQIYDACREKRIQMAGPHCGLFYEWNDSNGTVDVAAAIPAFKPIDYSDEIKTLTVPASKAIMIEYLGQYDKISNAHLAAQQYMEANNMNLIAPVIEEYITDGNTQPDPEKWLTRIYFLYQ